MKINQYLKNIRKTKTELAEDLGLSRPTLNQYIELFESGQKIENERYDIIFNRLFAERQFGKEVFDKKMEAVKFLLERDRKYDIGSLSPEAADIVARVHNNMVRDMDDEQWDKKVYDSILIILSSYKKSAIIRSLAEYFSDLNSDSDLSDLSEETKSYYSYFYMCFHRIVDAPPKFDEDSYKDFLLRKSELHAKREKQKESRSNNIKERMVSILKDVEIEFQLNGIEASEDEIMTEVIRRIRG